MVLLVIMLIVVACKYEISFGLVVVVSKAQTQNKGVRCTFESMFSQSMIDLEKSPKPRDMQLGMSILTGYHGLSITKSISNFKNQLFIFGFYNQTN
jgi:hypothetical protein